MNRLLATVLLLSGACHASAQSIDVDWKFFGGTDIDGKSEYQFYDSKSIVRRPDGHVEVWTKGLPESQLNRITNAKSVDKAFVDRVAMKVLKGYEPPISTAVDLKHDQAIEIMMDEDIADTARIEPMMRMLSELDCTGHSIRWLSLSGTRHGKSFFSNTPGEWMRVAPETSAAWLLKIICPRT